ncbi:MAG: SIR2 family protein [bacterium]|nr:SIR2 family protein [bacterium]
MRKGSPEGVCQLVKGASLSGRATTLLIGAGCSADAGVPAAQDLAALLKKRYPVPCAGFTSYLDVMAALPAGYRNAAIWELVENAGFKGLHVAIAHMAKKKVVSRVLTTNFDNLIERAFRHRKVVFRSVDLTVPQEYWQASMADAEVYHLHGTHDGQVLINTRREMIEHWGRHRKTMGPVFKEAGRVGPWIVAGYSGDNPHDPVMTLLGQVSRWEWGLYWLYRGEAPHANVVEELGGKPGVRFVRVGGAQEFFEACVLETTDLSLDLAREEGPDPPSE